LIQCFGVSKQAFYKRLKTYNDKREQDKIIVRLVRSYRKEVSQRTGGIKLYSELKAEMRNLGIKIGRDKFYRVLQMNNLLVPRTRRFHITTDSKHQFYKYKNLVQDKVPDRPEQLWVSDITYIKTQSGHNYLALVTDAYLKEN